MAVPRSTISSLVNTLTGVPVIWDGDPVPFAPVNGVHCVLYLRGIKEISDADYRREYDSIDDTYPLTIVQYCELSVSATFVGYGTTPSHDVCQTLKLRLIRPSAMQTLRAAGLALVEVGPIASSTREVDNRSIQYAACELTFSQVLSELDPDDSGDYIRTVNTDNVVPGTITGDGE